MNTSDLIEQKRLELAELLETVGEPETVDTDELVALQMALTKQGKGEQAAELWALVQSGKLFFVKDFSKVETPKVAARNYAQNARNAATWHDIPVKVAVRGKTVVVTNMTNKLAIR